MIKDCEAYKLSVILGTDKKFFYDIPKYQREYTWGNREWTALFNDIVNNGNGYFLGSIICVNQSKSSLKETRLQVIDGQQRITSLSLLLLAIYSRLFDFKGEFTESKEDKFKDLKKQIVVYNDDEESISRVVPQIQGNNQSDFYSLLTEKGLMSGFSRIKYAPRRKIYKGYYFFDREIDNFIAEEKKENPSLDDKTILFKLLEKVNDTVMVFIEVESNKDAYMLFESLNNRGVPLSAIDLIKNLLISESDVPGDKNSTDKCYKKWEEVLDFLGDDYGVQERFFRQYYNAYRDELNSKFESESKKYYLGYLATKSTVLDIYEKLIKDDYKTLLDNLKNEARTYSIIINNAKDEDKVSSYEKYLLNLERIGGAPSYLLLMKLISNQDNYEIGENDISSIIELLVKFFVRRNITDYPNTRNLNKLFMDIVAEIEGLKSKQVTDKVYELIVINSSDDAIFKSKLQGPLYQINTDSTRFLLCYYEDKYSTKEIHKNLWERDKGNKYIWTIEHIFPEGENIPQDWIDMIAGGDEKLAYEIYDKYVHTIGNLTITGYNSNLSNMSFQKKMDRKKDEGTYIGYRNGLKLNEDVVSEDKWLQSNIEIRSAKLINIFMEDFSL